MKRPCLLSAGHDTSDFDCGEETLNNFLKNNAWQNQLSQAVFTYVISEENRIIAYYSLSVESIIHEQALVPISAGQAKKDISIKKDIPILCISRLAVNKKNQDQQIGKNILKDALSRAFTIAQELGVRCIVGDIINERAAKFYQHYHFEQWTNDSFRLYLLMKDIRKSLYETAG
jgi:GNAT superfamily N-acetyltransferase